MKTALLARWARFAFAPMLLTVCMVLQSRGQVPALVNYQGRISNPDGSPLLTADYTLTFNVFDAATNGVRVWGPQVFDGAVAPGHGTRIPVVQGYFNVMLGPVDTNGASLADAFNGTSRFVEITVSNRPPMAPRQQILTTPFAFQAANSAKLAGYDWSALLGTNNPAAGTIPFSKLPPRPAGTNVGVGGIAVSPIVSFATNATTLVDVPGLAVTLQTTGRPVFIGLIPGTNSVSSYVAGVSDNGGGLLKAVFEFRRNSLRIADTYLWLDNNDGSTPGLRIPPTGLTGVDFPPAGTHDYKLRIRIEAGDLVEIQESALIAFEL